MLREHRVGLQLSNKLKYALLTNGSSSLLRYIFLFPNIIIKFI